MAYDTRVEELYEKKGDIHKEMQGMLTVPEPDWSPEDHQRWAAMDADFNACEQEIEQAESRAAKEARLKVIEEQQDRQRHQDKPEVAEMRAIREGRVPGATDDETRTLAFAAWMLPTEADQRCQMAAKQVGIPLHARKINLRFAPTTGETQAEEFLQIPDCRDYSRTLRNVAQLKSRGESRAMGISTGSTGGYFAPESMAANFEVALLQFNAARRYSRVVRTATGNKIRWPTVDDTSNTGEIVGEHAAVTEQDVTVGQYTTDPHKYSSKYVKVSIEMMQDSAFAVPGMLGTLLGTRIARRQATDFTTGDAAAKPSGILTGATDASVTLNADNAPNLANLIDLKHSVDEAYRQGGNGWLLSDTIVASIKKITADGQPLWQAGLATGEPNTIDGDPYFVAAQVPTAAATGTKSIAYGKLDQYLIHDVNMVELQRLDELHALNGQVTFLAFQRSDALLLDAGVAPVKYATNP